MPQWKTKHRCLGKCGDAPNPSHLRLIEIIPQFWGVQLFLIYRQNSKGRRHPPKSRFVSRIHPSSHRSGNLELLANWIWRPDFCLQQSSYHTVACCPEETAKGLTENGMWSHGFGFLLECQSWRCFFPSPGLLCSKFGKDHPTHHVS